MNLSDLLFHAHERSEAAYLEAGHHDPFCVPFFMEKP